MARHRLVHGVIQHLGEKMMQRLLVGATLSCRGASAPAPAPPGPRYPRPYIRSPRRYSVGGPSASPRRCTGSGNAGVEEVLVAVVFCLGAIGGSSGLRGRKSPRMGRIRCVRNANSCSHGDRAFSRGPGCPEPRPSRSGRSPSRWRPPPNVRYLPGGGPIAAELRHGMRSSWRSDDRGTDTGRDPFR